MDIAKAVHKEGKQTPYRGPFCQKIVCASFLARFWRNVI